MRKKAYRANDERPQSTFAIVIGGQTRHLTHRQVRRVGPGLAALKQFGASDEELLAYLDAELKANEEAQDFFTS